MILTFRLVYGEQERNKIRINPDSVSNKSKATSSSKILPPIRRNQELENLSKMSRSEILSIQRNKVI